MTVGKQEVASGVWFLTFDGRILGDSRGYDREGVRKAAYELVDHAKAQAERDGTASHLVLARAGW